ncbi:MAG TPA: biosynthetic peptidoglycan transglycosylase [Solirubrobacteraceae bacterium]|jgi:penicillin-binding protein 1A|nr:biosynthetic peptidoglycan transglycosylase [Solirubrobacteraceae bacterium]
MSAPAAVLEHRRRLRWVAALALVPLLVVVAFSAAWLSSPGVADLQQRVAAMAAGHGGRALPLRAIAPVMRRAVVATEDERFYSHAGIDVIGLMRALPYDLGHLSLAQGGSTITEQLAKLVYLGGNDHNPWAKLRDAAIALRIEGRWSKEQILADYLDIAYFGGGAFGVQAASRYYFRVPASALTLAQASLLAGLVQAPTAYDPFSDPSGARTRQLEALRSMVRNGMVSRVAARATLARPLPLARGRGLPALPVADVDPGPPFAWPSLALGAAIAALATAALVRLPLRVPARIATVLGGIAGLLIAMASFRGV